MPITQAQMLAQVHESRKNHDAARALRELILNTCEMAIKRHPTNAELVEVLTAIQYNVQITPLPDDRETYLNERYYSRFAKRNAKARERQQLIRSGAFHPQERFIASPRVSVKPAPLDAIADPFSEPKPLATKKGGGPVIKFPRDFEDDADLEFEGGEFPTDGQNLFARPVDKPE